MVSHAALLVVIISVKSNRLCSYSVAKYKLSKNLFQSIKFKYFFLTDQSVNAFSNGDIVFISGKYVVESSEPHFAIAYASVVDDKNPNREFDATDLHECVPHCVYSVTINREPKQIDKFIHFDTEAIEYNSITSKPDIKMDMTIVYPLKSPKFKYLGHLGSNIKLQANYFVSGLIRFSKSGKMIIEATDIDYLKTSTIKVNLSESSSLATQNAPSIIDLIDDDLNPANPQTSEDSTNNDVENETSYASENNNAESNNEEDLHDEFEEDVKLQPKKKKGNTTGTQEEKGRRLKNSHY
ncbi:hypothetical protein C2G38_2055982 [Gigaspora rosea]|uniref:Uncharacterized protein n=1 Tax=Gigaspora rosea TaxID=44941 RepID=A0A397W4U5_9GLOM|nr:hypothetical protein C2G38_2055982 [Gigaspora rosea]